MHPHTVDTDPRVLGAAPELARSLPYRRAALIAGLVGLGVLLIVDVPGVANIRQYRSPYTVFSHLTLSLIAVGLSPRFRAWIGEAARLSPGARRLGLGGALVGPVLFMLAFCALAPKYGHELFTREWGIVEPLQFVLWLTAAWLALERARQSPRGSADDRAFRLAAWACVLLALEEIDYLGVVSLVARLAGVPKGRIGGQHIGGFHDLVNALGKASLVLGVLVVAAVAALVLAWCLSRGLHRVALRELGSPTSLPLIGAFVFLATSQLADIDHPALRALEDLSVEEPLELLAVVCVNASLLAKLIPGLTRCS